MKRALKGKSASLFSRLKIRLGRKTMPGRIYDEAAEKFLSLHEDNTGAEDWQAFQAWVSESDSNARVMEQMDSIWRGIKQLDSIPWPSEAECREDDYDGDQSIPIASAKWCDPAVADGLKFRHRRLICLPVSVAAAASVVLAFVLWPLLSGAPAGYSTGVGEHRLVSLQDGSEVLLGAKTKVRVNYSSERRQVYLDAGEALFTVAKDHVRPFVVSSGRANVVAIGTQFNVRRHRDDVVVSVVEGSVKVSSDSLGRKELRQLAQTIPGLPPSVAAEETQRKAATLTIGQQIKMNDKRKLSKLKEVKGSDVLSWRDGRLVYSGEPLSTVISDINRYHDRPVRIVDSELERLLFSGTVHKDEIDDWLEGLRSVFDLRVMASGQNILIMANRD